MKVKLHKNKGITLIALIITVIVLLILAGVAVNMLVGEDGILSHTKTSTDKYSIESAKEELRLDILNIQTEILKTEGRKATLEDLQARIDLAKYEIEMHYEPVATSTPVANPATYVIVKRIGTNYYFTVDDKLVITNVEEITEENSPISKFTIQLSNTTYKDTTVTINEIPTSEAGTIEKYDYVAQTTDNKIELTNVTETTKKITGLTEQTAYKVYVIAYDNAGNKRKSNVVSITTPEYTPPTPSAPVIGANSGTPRAGRDLDSGKNYTVGEETVKYQLTWADMAEIAKGISNTLTDSDTTNNITSKVSEFNITYDGTTYLIGVGDRMRINGKVVRILGFNHDILSGYSETKNEDGSITVNSYSNAYGGQHKYAGISFEYVDMITGDTAMNPNNSNANGWAKMPLRNSLNSEAKGSILAGVRSVVGANTIKKVKKEYIKTYYDAGTLQTGENASKDYLWLLSCGEIWSSGYSGTNPRGYAITKEGNQYKYYAMINATYNVSSESSVYLKKPSSSTTLVWWLRSPYFELSSRFCTVDNQR